jgi:tetratricopeptide (TPR) repeat protein
MTLSKNMVHRMIRRAVLAVALLVAGISCAPAGNEKTWVGQNVMPRHAKVKFSGPNGDTIERDANVWRAPAKVLEEKDGWLRVLSRGTEARVLKSDMVLVGDAEAHYTDYLRTKPDESWAWNMRGNMGYQRREYDNAIKDYSEAIRLRPTDSASLYSRGYMWYSKKDYEKALADYDETLRLDRKNVSALNDKSWILATCPNARWRDGKTSVELANKAIELADKDRATQLRDTLAAGYAEIGEFDKAVVEEMKVLEDKSIDKQVRVKCERRLELYRQKKPCRDHE